MVSRPLVAYDYVAIVELIFYFFALIGALILCMRHGFTKNAGWRGLIVLALARVIGASFRIATIWEYSNINLYIGWETLSGLGLAPLILLIIGLLSRIFESASRSGRLVVQNKYQRIIELLLMTALILLIVGGIESTFTETPSGSIQVTYSNLSHVAVYLMITVVALIFLEIVLAFRCHGYVAQGEHRVLFAACASMPFVIVRLVYSCLLILVGINTNAYLYLGLSSLMEMAVTLISEVMGFTLEKQASMPIPQFDEELGSLRK